MNLLPFVPHVPEEIVGIDPRDLLVESPLPNGVDDLWRDGPDVGGATTAPTGLTGVTQAIGESEGHRVGVHLFRPGRLRTRGLVPAGPRPLQ
jgi:hypothetical protein